MYDAGFCTCDSSGSLIVREPEKLVLPEWASGGESELVLSQLRLAGCEEVPRIHRVVTQELKDIAVEAVGTRLGDGVHHGAAEFSVFRVKAVGDKPEFLDGIEVRNQSRAQVAPFADVAAIDQKRVGRLGLGIYRDIAGV